MRRYIHMLLLGLASTACTDLESEPPDDTTASVEQHLEPVPPCPGTIIYYFEAYGACGSCTATGHEGRRAYKVAYCEENGLKGRVAHACVPWCSSGDE